MLLGIMRQGDCHGGEEKKEAMGTQKLKRTRRSWTAVSGCGNGGTSVGMSGTGHWWAERGSSSALYPVLCKQDLACWNLMT